MITFVLGGNKSGKSDFALDLLAEAQNPAVFIATGKARDLEFREQIRAHRLSRTPNLEVLEVSTDLPRALRQAKLKFRAVLVDSLDYWLFACREAGCEQEKIQEFKEVLGDWNDTALIMVSCEAGLGPLPGGVQFERSYGVLARSTDAQPWRPTGLSWSQPGSR